MDVLPSNIMFDIFSKVPAKCLARSRCVSKVWCNYINDRYLVIIHNEQIVEEPTPILYHPHLCREKITRSLCFHVIESKQTGASDNYVLEAKEGPFFEYLRETPQSKSSRVKIRVQGSCNGLICLSQDDGKVVTSLVVVHPLRKECYELPPLSVRFDANMFRDSCGFGFDASTNTLKMVCVLCKSNMVVSTNNPDVVKKNLCTMVHVFGTNSWREIPQVPPYPITNGAVFANGCLHWLVSQIDVRTQDGGRPVIWFDVEKEEFGLIGPPKRMCDLWRNYSCRYDQVVDLNGEVGYVCTRTMEFWVLKNKEWVPHCRFAKEITPSAYIYVMGCWNKDGDILIKCKGRGDGKYGFFVYNLKTGKLQRTNIAGMNDALSPSFIMYPNKLSSIHGINANSISMKKTVLKKSCQHVISNFH